MVLCCCYLLLLLFSQHHVDANIAAFDGLALTSSPSALLHGIVVMLPNVLIPFPRTGYTWCRHAAICCFACMDIRHPLELPFYTCHRHAAICGCFRLFQGVMQLRGGGETWTAFSPPIYLPTCFRRLLLHPSFHAHGLYRHAAIYCFIRVDLSLHTWYRHAAYLLFSSVFLTLPSHVLVQLDHDLAVRVPAERHRTALEPHLLGDLVGELLVGATPHHLFFSIPRGGREGGPRGGAWRFACLNKHVHKSCVDKGSLGVDLRMGVLRIMLRCVCRWAIPLLP